MAKIDIPVIDGQTDGIGSDIIRDLSSGQITERDGDKIDFSKLQRAVNVNVEDGDLEGRNGIEDFVSVQTAGIDVDSYGIAIFKDGSTNRLVVAKEGATDDTKADIVEYDRTTKAETVLESDIDSQNEYNFADQNDFLYVVNGETDINVIDPGSATSTISLPTAGEFAVQAVSDGSRVWITTTLGITRMSDAQTIGKVTTFTPSGVDLGRAAIVNSEITEVVSMKSSAPYVALASQNRVEICAAPNFEQEGVTTFPDDFPTVKRAFNGIGTTSRDGMASTPFGFFIMPPNKNELYLLKPTSSSPKIFDANSGRFDEIDHSNAKLFYDDQRGYLYIHGEDRLTRRSVTTVFDVNKEVFWEYENILVDTWVGDQDNVYFVPTYSSNIIEAFKDGVYTDNGADIDFIAESADTYADNISFWKWALRMFANVEYWGDFAFNFSLVDLRKAKGSPSDGDSVFSKDFDLFMNDSPLDDSPPYFGLGILGNTGFDFESEEFSEYFDIDELINAAFFRGFIRITGSSNIRFRIRGAGVLYQQTTKPLEATTLS